MPTSSRSPFALFALSRGFVALSAIAAVLATHPHRAANGAHDAVRVDLG
jgi:hypothetical protein